VTRYTKLLKGTDGIHVTGKSNPIELVAVRRLNATAAAGTAVADFFLPNTIGWITVPSWCWSLYLELPEQQLMINLMSDTLFRDYEWG
jgi:hypothetical protein